jgi:tetratricopeptide (TPR) repeat protein
VSASGAFRDVERLLSLAHGFVLVPVECGPDVARAMADALDAQGWPCLRLEPVDDPGWHELVARLLEAKASEARVVVVVGSRQPAAGVHAALRLVNQRRDSIATALARPLLWCGPPEFLKLAWEGAPDFWSIRAMTSRLTTSGTPWAEAPLWPGVWVTDPPERLRDMLAMAKGQGDEAIASRTAALLAEALVARGEIDEAAEVIGEARSTPALRIVEAVVAAAKGDRARAEAIVTDETLAAGAPELEGRRLIALGNLRLDVDRAAAQSAYEQAARLLGAARDTSNIAVALADLGLVAMSDGALDQAESRLDEALDVAHRAGDARVEARVLSKLGRLHLLRRDSRRACAVLEEALTRASDAGDPRAEGEILRRLARAYLELGDPEKAEQDARRAASIERAMGDEQSALEAEDIARDARAAVHED